MPGFDGRCSWLNGDDRRRFRQPVALEDPDVERLPRTRAAPRPASGAPPEAHSRSDAAAPLHVRAGRARMLQQRPVHRRHADPETDLFARERLEHGGRIEARHQDEAEAAVERGVHLRRLRGRVKQRQRDERHVLFRARRRTPA